MSSKSWNAWLTTFELGERRYVETTVAAAAQSQRTMCAPVSRRPASLSGREFSSRAFTAAGSQTLGDVRYLICVERTK